MTISAITAYLSGGTVTQKEILDLKKGINIFDFVLAGQDSGVSVKCTLPIKYTLSENSVSECEVKRIADVKAQIARLETDAEEYDEQLELSACEKKLIMRNCGGAVLGREGFESYKTLFLNEISGLIAKEKILKREAQTLRKQIQELNALLPAKKFCKNLHIEITADKPCKEEITVKSFNRGFNFETFYKIDTYSANDAGDIRLCAKFTQNSGYDLKKVSVALNMSSPDTAETLPVFSGEILQDDYAEARPVFMNFRAVADHCADSAGAASYVNQTYNLGEVSLLDGETEQYTLSCDSTAFSKKYYAMPFISNSVYYVGVFDYDFNANEAKIYLDGNLVFKTRLQQSNEGMVPFGTEERILLSRFSDKKIFSKSGAMVKSFAVTDNLKNLTDTDVDVEIIERIPVSGDDRYKVEAEAVESDAEGKIVRHIQIAANQTAQYKFNYKVTKSVKSRQ